MSKAELVKGLSGIINSHPLSVQERHIILDTFTALSSQDDVRDRALEDGWRTDMEAVKTWVGVEVRAVFDFDTTTFRHTHWRPLKSNPKTEERRTGDTQPPAPEVKQGLVEWLYDYAGKDGPPYSGTVSYADLVNFAAKIDELRELDTRMGGKS